MIMNRAGLAYSSESPQPGMAYHFYKNDSDRYRAAWHSAICLVPECEVCQRYCDEGLIISCDQCGKVHHTDWLGWVGQVDEQGRCFVQCPECAKGECEL